MHVYIITNIVVWVTLLCTGIFMKFPFLNLLFLNKFSVIVLKKFIRHTGIAFVIETKIADKLKTNQYKDI